METEIRLVLGRHMIRPLLYTRV